MPPEIEHNTALRELNLTRNWITALPEWLAALPNLRSLKLARNFIATFPDVILDMTRLQELSLAYNPLAAVPPPLSRLTGLHRLALTGCQLQTLPRDLFRHMPHLNCLELAENQLSELPFILPLASLQTLDLGGNNFAALPSEVVRLRSHRKANIAIRIDDNPFLPETSPLLDKLAAHVPSLRDLALTKCTSLQTVRALKEGAFSTPRSLCARPETE